MNCCKEEKQIKRQPASGYPVAAGLPVLKLKCNQACEKCRKKRELKSRVSKKLPLVVILLLPALAASAQNIPVARSFWTDPIHDPNGPIYFVLFTMVVVLVLVITVVILTMRVLRLFREQLQIAEATSKGVAYVPALPWWNHIWTKINSLTPLEDEKALELDHDYDGIKELDNHLPPWWKGLFYGTIAFAVVYLFMFHILQVLPLPAEEYQRELAAAADQQRLLKAGAPADVVDENKLTYSKDDPLIAKGKIVFASNNCASCHRPDGGGNIGPNLTDAYWLHGGSATNIFVTIRDGLVDKGMPAWGKVISPKDVKAVTFYVISLQGSNPVNPKKQQGELYSPPAQPVKADTSRTQAALK